MHLRAWPVIVGLGAVPVVGACSQPAFQCADDQACGAGTCEPSGYCSFPDDDCDSGRRYGDQAPVSFAGICVPVMSDTGAPAASSSGTATSQGSTSAPTSTGPAADDSTGTDGSASTTEPAATSSGDTDECPSYYPDADGDGFGGEPAIEGCGGAPAGYTERPGDCDDSDRRIYPGGLGCPNPDSLVGWWRFDTAKDGVVSNDVAGNGDALLEGTPTIAVSDGPYGAALHLEEGQSAEVASVLETYAPGGALPAVGTIEAWVRPEPPPCDPKSTLTCGAMVAYLGPAGAGDGYGSVSEHHVGMLDNGLGTYQWRVFMNSPDDSCSAGGPPVEFGQWTHIAMTWSEDVCNLWIDGAPVASDVKGPLTEDVATAWIGRPNSEAFRRYRGEIDEVMFFDEARSQAQIQADCGCED